MRRDEDPDDRRAKIISLTDEGRSVTAKIEKELIGLRADVLNGVSSEDLEATLRVFAAFKLGASSATQQAQPASPQAAKPAKAAQAQTAQALAPPPAPIRKKASSAP